MVPLKYLSDFWRTLEMPLISCEIELILDWSANCLIIYTNIDNEVPTFTITETNLYVTVVTLSIQDNAKLFPQLKSGFKKTIRWVNYLVKPESLAQNANFDHLIEPSLVCLKWNLEMWKASKPNRKKTLRITEFFSDGKEKVLNALKCNTFSMKNINIDGDHQKH